MRLLSFDPSFLDALQLLSWLGASCLGRQVVLEARHLDSQRHSRFVVVVVVVVVVAAAAGGVVPKL